MNTRAPGAVCGDHVFIPSLNGHSKGMYTCSVSACMSRSTAGVWNQAAAPPVRDTTKSCVSIRLLAIGGLDYQNETTTAVHMYDPNTDSRRSFATWQHNDVTMLQLSSKTTN